MWFEKMKNNIKLEISPKRQLSLYHDREKIKFYQMMLKLASKKNQDLNREVKRQEREREKANHDDCCLWQFYLLLLVFIFSLSLYLPLNGREKNISSWIISTHTHTHTLNPLCWVNWSSVFISFLNYFAERLNRNLNRSFAA